MRSKSCPTLVTISNTPARLSVESRDVSWCKHDSGRVTDRRLTGQQGG